MEDRQNQPQLQCERCGALFNTQEALDVHNGSVHGLGGESLNETVDLSAEDEDERQAGQG